MIIGKRVETSSVWQNWQRISLAINFDNQSNMHPCAVFPWVRYCFRFTDFEKHRCGLYPDNNFLYFETKFIELIVAKF